MKETWPIVGSNWSSDEQLALDTIEIHAPDDTHPLSYLKWNAQLNMDLLRKAKDYDIEAMAYAVQIDTINSWFDATWLERPVSLDRRATIEGYRAFLNPTAKENKIPYRCNRCNALGLDQKPLAASCRYVAGDAKGCATCQIDLKLDCSFKDPKRIGLDIAKSKCAAALQELRDFVNTIKGPDPYDIEAVNPSLLLADAHSISALSDAHSRTVNKVHHLLRQLSAADSGEDDVVSDYLDSE